MNRCRKWKIPTTTRLILSVRISDSIRLVVSTIAVIVPEAKANGDRD